MPRDEEFYRHFNELHAVTVKVVRQLPEDKLDYTPCEPMMPARDLLFHMFSQEKVMLKGCKTGKIEVDDFRWVAEDLKAIGTVEDLATYGEQVHAETNNWVQTCSNEEYNRTIHTFFGELKPFQLLLSAKEHLIHHRGQFYVYLRMLGIQPLFVFTGELLDTD